MVKIVSNAGEVKCLIDGTGKEVLSDMCIAMHGFSEAIAEKTNLTRLDVKTMMLEMLMEDALDELLHS